MCGLLVAFANGKLGGKEIVYYRGQFGQDIQACNLNVLKPYAGESPRYKLILQQIWQTADALAKAGKIQLSTRPVLRSAKKGSVEFTEYVAIRVPPKATKSPKPAPKKTLIAA